MESRRVVTASGRVIVNGGVDLGKQPIWIEAPHIYKIDGWYYLLCAEGGTGYNHSEVVFRTRSLDLPFVPYDGNPILTQRDLDIERAHPVTTAGHADLVQAPGGRWWAVFLATRTYDRTYYNTGRETFLLPVSWTDGWPVILEQGREIPYRLHRPAAGSVVAQAEALTGNFSWRDEFDGNVLNPHWNMLRGFDRSWFELRDGILRMKARPLSMATFGQPAYLGRRQQHQRFKASTELRLPADRRRSAGIVAFQNETHHYYLGARRNGEGYDVFLEQASGGAPEIVQRTRIDARPGSPLILEISGDKGDIGFSYRRPSGAAVPLADKLNGRLLSTAVAEGFVGTTLGPHSRIETD
jgi:alpha-N-arabinofuranosidase